MKKPFAKTPGDFKPLARGYGGCIATDRSPVDGEPVRFMYREKTERDLDSGWRFTAGDETDAYMDDASKHEVYDCNTIANYDPEIIPFLNAPPGSAFERLDGDGPFVPVPDFELPE